MAIDNYKKVFIWGGWFRLSHWSLAISTLVLMFTGWLMTNSPYLHDPAQSYHYIAAGVFVFGLLLRIVVFITGSNQDALNALLPTRRDIETIKAMLLFYITLGKAPLPHWYAQNPLWKPVYLFIYVVMIVLVVSGVLMPEHTVIAGFFLADIHQFLAQFIFWFSLLHIAAVALHDYKAQSNDISAMIHGYKLFSVQQSLMKPEVSIQKIDISSIK